MKSIRTIMIAFSTILVVTISSILSTVLLFDMNGMKNMSVAAVSSSRMSGYDDAIKFQVQNVITLLNSVYSKQTSGQISEAEAKQEAISLIKNLRYSEDRSGYFWIDDLDYTLVAHPILPQNEGQNRFNLEDKNGVMIIQTILDIVKKNPEGGFSEFYFTKADGVTVAPKRTYSMLFKPWGWAVSSGNYYDDIDVEIGVLSKQIEDRFQSAFRVTIIIIFVVLFLSIFFSIGFAKRFSEPIITSAKFLEKMSGGDLSTKLPKIKAQTEIGRMQNQFNSFSDTLHEVILSVRNSADSLNNVAKSLDDKTDAISSGIKEITSNLKTLTSHAQDQNSSASETSGTMKKMMDAIDSLTQKIQGQSADVSQSSAAIEQMISNIESITANINQFSESFNMIIESSQTGSASMKAVIKMINSVADASKDLLGTNTIIANVASQTNLLAMNAAIEAAHAGEAGRGFAVVAGEIRSLSESTTKQSQVIGNTLKKVMENVSSVVNASVNADNVFSGMINRINEVNSLVLEINNSMAEQNSGSQQIVSSLAHIKNITEDIRTNSKEMDGNAKSVLSEIEHLEKLAEDFLQNTESISDSTILIENVISEVRDLSVNNKTQSNELYDKTKTFVL